MPRGGELSRVWRLRQLLGRSEGLAVEDAARRSHAPSARCGPHDLDVSLAECFDVPCPGDAARIGFVTQTRLKHEGAFARRPEFHVFLRRLLGRLSSLARFHGPGPLAVDFRELIERARSVVLERDETRWITWERYSGRQDRRMEWAGVVGAVTYRGDLEPFWPYLVFGQWTHAGSGTTFGLGGYRIEDSVPEDQGQRRDVEQR